MSKLRIDADAIDAIFAPYDSARQPGCVVGVALDGVPRYRRGFGVASIELPVPLSPSMRLRIGSTSKHFACLAFLLLVEDGRASTDDPVRRFLPELSPVADGVTMAQLMQHTSGLRCSVDLHFQFGGAGRVVPTGESLALLARQDGVNSPPGTRWCYNNGGYSLLSAAVERISGISFEDFLRDRIFTPVDMYDTELRRVDTDMVPNSASLHMPAQGGGWTRGVFPAAMAGEGGVISTIDDMLRWLKHMDAPVVGSTESWAAMKRSAVLKNNYPLRYGYGLMSGTYRGARVLHHPGGVLGGTSQMLKLVDLGLDIVVLSNRPLDSSGLAERIIDAVVPDLSPPPAVPARAVSGVWMNRDTGTAVSLHAVDGRQTIELGGTPVPAVLNDDGSLSPALQVFDMRIRFSGDDLLELVRFGEAEWLTSLQPAAGDPPAPLGTYRCPSVPVCAVVERTGDDVLLCTETRYGVMRYRLMPVGRNIWKATDLGGLTMLGGIVEFDNDGDAFLFSSPRTQRLRFSRKDRFATRDCD